MHKVMETSKKLIEEALRGLERGYNSEDLRVLGEAIDIIKDVKTIEAMEGDYEVEIKGNEPKVARLKEKDMMPQYDLDGNIEGTEIDDNIMMMNKHFRKYCAFKKEYQRTGGELDKTKSLRELEKFLYSMKEIMEELKTSSDFQTERDMIKEKLREMFNMY